MIYSYGKYCLDICIKFKYVNKTERHNLILIWKCEHRLSNINNSVLLYVIKHKCKYTK